MKHAKSKNMELIKRLTHVKIILLFLFVGTSICMFSQQTFAKITFQDSETKDFIRNVDFSFERNEERFRFFSNEQGSITFPFFENGISYTSKHGFYETKVFSLDSKAAKLKSDTLHFSISLKHEKIFTQQEVVVSAPGVPMVVYSSEKVSVSDFEMLPNGEILLLVYPKTLAKGSELMILKNKDIIQRFKLEDKPVELVRDFRGNPHVVCENGVFGIHRKGNELGIANLEKEYFMRYVFPIVDTAYSKMYFSNFNPLYPAFNYFSYDQLDSTYLNLVEIKDDLMMELYRSEYKWVDIRTKLWAKYKEYETGIDKEIWVGANYFTQSIYYKELYAPMFYRNDSIFVFDYYKDQLITFSVSGEKLASVPIYHHYQPKKTGWKRKLIQDTDTKQIYAYFEKDGNCYVKWLNTTTGELGERMSLEHKYIDKVAIHSNQVYYIYRPFESAQKKFLYKSTLPVDFK
jgi:hypothetical protein